MKRQQSPKKPVVVKVNTIKSIDTKDLTQVNGGSCIQHAPSNAR